MYVFQDEVKMYEIQEVMFVTNLWMDRLEEITFILVMIIQEILNIENEFKRSSIGLPT